MSVLLVGLPLCAGFAVLTFLTVRMQQDLRRAVTQLSQIVELLPVIGGGQEEEPPDEWPRLAALRASSPAPPELRSSTNGGWALAVFGRDAAQVATVLPQGAEFDLLKSRYSLVAAVTDGNVAGTAGGIDLISVSERTLDGVPLPSVGMIDPAGLIQGIGSVTNTFDLLTFVHDGEHHGFGNKEK